MNGIAFVPLHDSTNRDDVSIVHGPAAREWCASRGLPAPLTFDNRRPPTVRGRDIIRELKRHRTPLDAVAFFGHAFSRSIQAGFHIDDVPSFALVLVSVTTAQSTIEIYAVDPVVDTSGLCATHGFADVLAKEMRKSGRWTGHVEAHAMTPDGAVGRVFDGEEKAEGMWLR